MYGVIVATHGNYADGLKSTLKLVCGDMENLRTINYTSDMTFEDLENKYDEVVKSLGEYEKIFILTDIFGGTPFNRAVMKYAGNENIKILAGVNFTLLYSALTVEGDSFEEDAEEIIEEAKNEIAEFKPACNTEDDDCEDGI